MNIQNELIKVARELCVANCDGKYENFTGIIDLQFVHAKVKNATFLISGKYVFWEKGTWLEGDGYHVEWKDGLFIKGELKLSRTLGGTFKHIEMWQCSIEDDTIIEYGELNICKFWNGVFKNGIFSHGSFHHGIFEGGTFLSSSWFGGTWKGGKFLGTWLDLKHEQPK